MRSAQFVCYYAPAPVREAGTLGGHRHPSSVRLSPGHMRLPHRLQGQKVKSQGGAGAYCGGDLAAQLVHSVCLWAGLRQKWWADLIETWCCDWANQSEELINFWWWYGPGCRFWITFPLPSPLQKGDFRRFISNSRTVIGQFWRHLALMLTRDWIHSILRMLQHRDPNPD